MRVRSFAFWVTAVAAIAAGAGSLALWASARRARGQTAAAKLRLRRVRKRLRTAEAELQEVDEYLAATGELLECYMEEFGALPVNPFAEAAAGDAPLEEWPEELSEAGLREE